MLERHSQDFLRSSLACRPLAEQREPKWLIVYAVLVISVICISMARALAFFESTFRLEPLPYFPAVEACTVVPSRHCGRS